MMTILSLNPSLTMALFQLFQRLLLQFQSSTRHGRVMGDSNSTSKASATTIALTRPMLPSPTPGEAFAGAALSNSIGLLLRYSVYRLTSVCRRQQ